MCCQQKQRGLSVASASLRCWKLQATSVGLDRILFPCFCNLHLAQACASSLPGKPPDQNRKRSDAQPSPARLLHLGQGHSSRTIHPPSCRHFARCWTHRIRPSRSNPSPALPRLVHSSLTSCSRPFQPAAPVGRQCCLPSTPPSTLHQANLALTD